MSGAMSGETDARRIPGDDPLAIQMLLAVRTGNVEAVGDLLQADPGLATARFVGRGSGTRTALHLVADWPGYFPNGPAITRRLLDAGADPNARTTGRGRQETPLHWAASSDDVDVAEVLIDGGADIEAPDGSIGTPLDNAIGYACWHVARLLVARGAKVEKVWHAAALGLLQPLDTLLQASPPAEELSKGFWHACAGGQRRAAELLLSRGADLTWVPDYAEGTPLDAATGLSTRQENVIAWLRDLGAPSSKPKE